MTETCYIAATIRHYSIQVRHSCTAAHSAVTYRLEYPEYSHIAEVLPPNNGGTVPSDFPKPSIAYLLI
jgi:hypothetical protein